MKQALADTHYNIGVKLDQQQRPAEAVASYRAAIRFDRNLSEAFTGLGVALSHLSNYEGAVVMSQEALRLRPILGCDTIRSGCLSGHDRPSRGRNRIVPCGPAAARRPSSSADTARCLAASSATRRATRGARRAAVAQRSTTTGSRGRCTVRLSLVLARTWRARRLIVHEWPAPSRV